MMNFKKKLVSFAVIILSLYLCTIFAFATASMTGTVTASSLNIRSGPGTSNNVIGGVLRGSVITIIDHSGNWYKIQTSDSQTGWVYKDYVQLKDISRGDDVTRSAALVSTTGDDMVSYAKNFLGVPYVWGGNTPAGFDCSGFVKYVYNHAGITLFRVAADQATEGTWVSKDNLQPGDLVFFDTDGGYNYINHVGMYIGNGQFIQASSGRGYVVISDLTTGFYANAYMTARRFTK